MARIAVTLRLIAVLTATALVCSGAALAGGSTVRYEGQLAGDVGEVELSRTSASSTVVRFSVRHIPLQCDDGTSTEITLRHMGAPIRRNGRFYTDSITPDRSGGIELWTFRGRVRRDASGKLLYVYNVGDNPDGGTPDCSTEGELAWSARRK
jgi:hypothetical protein